MFGPAPDRKPDEAELPHRVRQGERETRSAKQTGSGDRNLVQEGAAPQAQGGGGPPYRLVKQSFLTE